MQHWRSLRPALGDDSRNIYVKEALPVARFAEGSTRGKALVKESVGACEPKKTSGEHVLEREEREPPCLQFGGIRLSHCETAFHQHVVSSPITGMETSQSLMLGRAKCACLCTSLTRDP